MMLNLDKLKNNGVFMRHVRWDVTPDIIFKPRFASTSEDREQMVDEIKGFMFYVESAEDVPALMVMKTYNLTSKTIGEVSDVPVEMLERTIKAGGRDFCGMFGISPEVEAWLKERLGIK